MKGYVIVKMMFAMLAAVLMLSGVKAQSPQIPPTSVKSSLPSAIRAKGDEHALAAACSQAADELSAVRAFAASLESQARELRTALAAERELNALLTELAATQKAQTKALTATIDAKNEALDAKGRTIAAQEELIGNLKQKRSSIWRRVGDVLLGAGAAIILK